MPLRLCVLLGINQATLLLWLQKRERSTDVVTSV
jgi:hypothetical protein